MIAHVCSLLAAWLTPRTIVSQIQPIDATRDESRIVVARKYVATNNNDLWLTDPLGDNPVKFTFDPGSDLLGLWSPDAGALSGLRRATGALISTRKR